VLFIQLLLSIFLSCEAIAKNEEGIKILFQKFISQHVINIKYFIIK